MNISSEYIPENVPNKPHFPAAGKGGRWEKLGQVGVDSASIGITDLLTGTQSSSYRPANQDPGVLYAASGSRWAGDWGTGIRFMSGFGDGGYDVWGWIVDYGGEDEVDERIAQVVITLIDDDDLKHWRVDCD